MWPRDGQCKTLLMGGMNTGLVGKGKREKKIYFIEREIGQSTRALMGFQTKSHCLYSWWPLKEPFVAVHN
jgi:hypothetical protein